MNDFFKINVSDVIDSFENGSLLLLEYKSQLETLQGKKVEYNSMYFFVQNIKMGNKRIFIKLAPLV